MAVGRLCLIKLLSWHGCGQWAWMGYTGPEPTQIGCRSCDCWSIWFWEEFASTINRFMQGLRPVLGLNLKFFVLMKNCFNKIRKMLKQIKRDRECFKKWKKLGDKSGLFRDYVEANFSIIWLLQHWFWEMLIGQIVRQLYGISCALTRWWMDNNGCYCPQVELRPHNYHELFPAT